MLVERRRSAFPIEFLARVTTAWILVAGLLIAVNWATIAEFVTRGAQAAALIAVPLATLGCAMLLSARIAWRLLGDEEATLAAVIPALSIPMLFELGTMRIDQQGWQIVCALAAVNALMSRRPILGGWSIGGICAVWLAISLDGLVVTIALLGVLASHWLRDRNARMWLVGAFQALAVGSLLFFVLAQVLGAESLVYDATGFALLAAFAWGAIALSLLGRFEPMPVGPRLGGIILAIGGAAAILIQFAPASAQLPWVPIWDEGIVAILHFAVTPLIGIVAALHLTASSHDWLRRFWSDYTLVLVATFAFAMLNTEAALVACVLSAPPLAWQVRRWLRRIRSMKRMAPRLAATCGLSCALLPAFPMIVFATVAAA
ncbi:MAG: hypothetical protein QNJ15_04245 [Erythrobacter sp.]|nr:hypothetical protein [Erythrobacter sp.]